MQELQKKAQSGFEMLGNVSNHLADTWDDLMVDYTRKFKIKSLEKAFQSDEQIKGEQIARHNRTAIKKGLTMLKMPTSENSKYGAPIPISPKYHPLILRDLADNDPDVSAGIDAIAVNEGRVPWTLTPALPIDTYTDEAGRTHRRITNTNEEISDELWAKMQAEHKLISAFVKNICPGESFSDLRYNRVYNLNQLGNTYWQAIRNPKTGETVSWKPIKDDATIRLCKDDLIPVANYEYLYAEGHEIKSITMDWTFKRYVQSVGMKKTYFKSFGDKRFLDRKTGIYYDNASLAPVGAKDATELWHFKMHGIDYGRPKWTPATYSIQTNRAAQLTDRETMNNSGVPKMIMVLLNCSDATLESTMKKSVQKIKESGSKEMVMVVRLKPEAVGVGNLEQPVSTDFRIERLSNQQEKEGLYLQMRKHNQGNIATTLRLPDLLFGRSADSMNRATAFIMMSTVEKQVFAPGRQSFDEWMNDVVFVDKGFRYWRFTSQSGDLNDAELYIHILRLFNEYGGITPNELRLLAPELLGVDLRQINEDWAIKPRYISTMDSLMNDGEDGGGAPVGGAPDGSAPTAQSFKPVDLSIDGAHTAIGKQVASMFGAELSQMDVFLYKPGDI